MNRKIIKIVPRHMSLNTDGRTYSLAPTQYHSDHYYTQVPSDSLFKAMRDTIRKITKGTITTCGLEGNRLWEIGDTYVFITNKNTAKRAQKLLIRFKGLDYSAYYSCSDLE